MPEDPSLPARLRRVFVVGSYEPSHDALFAALGDFCEVVHLNPVLSLAGWLPRFLRANHSPEGELPRGAWSHRRWLGRLLAPRVERRLLETYGRADALVITDPSFWIFARHIHRLAPILAYYVCDDYASYPYVRLDQEQVVATHADLLLPVSRRLADVLKQRYGLANARFHIVPNGIPSSWLPPSVAAHPPALPDPLPADFRPLVGIIGVIGRRVDLSAVLEAHDALPALHWLFIGPVRQSVPGLAELQASPRCRFLGALPYDTLQPWFASLDAAVLPFTTSDINPCSSPVRFFSQLPTGQPILYTGNCDQIGEVAHLARHCADGPSLIDALEQLLRVDFHDGFAELRHQFARQCTWQLRAAGMAEALTQALATVTPAGAPQP